MSDATLASTRHPPKIEHQSVSGPMRLAAQCGALVPGLALTASIAAIGFTLRQLPGLGILSPMILAILLGIGFHNLIGTPQSAKPGIRFSLKRLLRLAVILLGLQLTVQQIGAVGVTGLLVIATTLIATFLFTKWLGRVLGVDRKLVELIAAGTSICGASAVLATNTVTEASDEDVAYAIAGVTIFGSIAMFVYPTLPGLLHLTPRAYGFWAGASIHEIAQVVAAAFQAGKEAGDYATIAKLTRVTLLAPVVISLELLASRRQNRDLEGGNLARKKLPLPLFVLGFIALVAINSAVTIPDVAKHGIALGTTFLLSLALAGMGLETDIRKLRTKGIRPLLLSAAASLFIAGISLLLVKLTG